MILSSCRSWADKALLQQNPLCRKARRESRIQECPGSLLWAPWLAGAGDERPGIFGSLDPHSQRAARRLPALSALLAQHREKQPELPDSKWENSWECFLERMGMLLWASWNQSWAPDLIPSLAVLLICVQRFCTEFRANPWLCRMCHIQLCQGLLSSPWQPFLSPANLPARSGRKDGSVGSKSSDTHERIGGTTAPGGVQALLGALFPLWHRWFPQQEGKARPWSAGVLGQLGLSSCERSWDCPRAGKFGSVRPQGLGRGCGVRDTEQLLSHLTSDKHKPCKPLLCPWLCSARSLADPAVIPLL